jgi:hypothetical protein
MFYVHFIVTVSCGANFLMSMLTLFKYCIENKGDEFGLCGEAGFSVYPRNFSETGDSLLQDVLLVASSLCSFIDIRFSSRQKKKESESQVRKTLTNKCNFK